MIEQCTAIAERAIQAARQDEQRLQEAGMSIARARLHAGMVLPSYLYQFAGAPAVGIWALTEGYNHNGIAGVLGAGIALGAVVAPQFALVGANAVATAERYPTAGRSLRESFPRLNRFMDASWDANRGGITKRGGLVGGLGIQSYVFSQGFRPPRPLAADLRRTTTRAGVLGTAFSALTATELAAVAKATHGAGQLIASQTGNLALLHFSQGFDREVMQEPARTGALATGVVFGRTLLNVYARSEHSQRHRARLKKVGQRIARALGRTGPNSEESTPE